ncbi:hypothetical protein A7P98_00215 [Eikenella sp. NML080894]|uniref:hypothetical protein n=1 Tax=Eikenella sp. NML080894 TaxID=1795830 RepID=UPI0007E26A02|nr:hypothetical protein [Eikenella sp. NML080894]OAM37618.1 hypothetical protein A7P98_00215 [Eikenella sp. NML080894]
MTQRIKFGDMVRFHDGVEAVVLECNGTTMKVGYRGDGYDYFKVADIGKGIELIANLETQRLDWMILRDYPDDMSAEDKAFALQTERENIDTFLRLDAEQGAAA